MSLRTRRVEVGGKDEEGGGKREAGASCFARLFVSLCHPWWVGGVAA